MAGSQTTGSITVRSLAGHDEFAQAVDLQRAIWKFEDLELLPVRFFVVASRIGGQTLGAFDGGRMVGFLLAIPGVKPDGQKYIHSHMLGVVDEFRNAGVGQLLKLEQKKDALNRGFEMVEWTFDPFDVKNAYFNLERLGAVVSQYVPNMYGATTSPLHGGLPTDRCVAQWWIASQREKLQVTRAIPVPAQRTAATQRELGEAFHSALDQGLAATGFERREHGGSYLLSPWKSK